MVVFSVLVVDTPALCATRGGGRATPVASARRTTAKASAPVAEPVEDEEEYETIEEVIESVIEPEEPIIENKSSQFEDALSSMSEGSLNMSKDNLAEQIRKQREAFEARENIEAAQKSQQNSLISGKNACDTGLRECMQEKCGSDFSKCALDGDTLFGDKLNLCRKDVQCTGEEFKLFTIEIKADRDANAELSSYNKVIECGNKYNDCMQKECGTTFNKCLGKAAADKATKACETIAKNCTEQDSGLVGRFGNVIGQLRGKAEEEVKVDEDRMYKLRDLMSSQCKRLGAMFDERSFDCVYTVNFYAGETGGKPISSRKAYAGNSFVCTQEWFGTNVTTYMENAARETRAQKSASSAMLGSGVGTAAGLISSGAVGRAIDTHKAKKELKAEEKKQNADAKAAEKAEEDAAKAQQKEEKQQQKDAKKQAKEEKCSQKGGTMKAGSCWCDSEIMGDSSTKTCEELRQARQKRKDNLKPKSKRGNGDANQPS